MQTHRYRVRSAQEAVERIRKELGESAQVVSVRSLPARGLLRFWRAPLLEVTATVGEPPVPEEPQQAQAVVPSTIEASVMPQASGRRLEAYTQVASRQAGSGAGLTQRLESLGVEPAVVLLLRTQPEWKQWQELSFSEALTQIHGKLRALYQDRPRIGLGPRVAFVGTPGVGKTTMLCKWLTRQIFKHHERPSVLKLEGSRAQSDDALKFFTQMMDTPFWQSWEGPTGLDSGPLLVDTQGLGLSERAQASALGKELDALGIKTRVLVLNLCYSQDLLQASCGLAQRMGATHVAFSQVDLCAHSSKLWPFLVIGNLSPAFFSQDPNPSGVLSTDFETFLGQTPLESLVYG